MGPSTVSRNLPAARDSTTSTISGRRRAPWCQRLRFPVSCLATRRAQMVVRNRAAIIRKAELTGDAGGLVSVSRRHRVSETERKREREGRRNESEGEQYTF